MKVCLLLLLLKVSLLAKWLRCRDRAIGWLEGAGLKCPYELCDACDAADEFLPVDPRDIKPLLSSLLLTKATKEFGEVRMISFKSIISVEMGETDNNRFFPRVE